MRKILLLVTICALLIVSIPALAATGDAVLFPPDANNSYNNSAESIAAVDDTLYLLSYNGLYQWHVGEAEPSLVSDKVSTGQAGTSWEDMSSEEQAIFENTVNMLFGGEKLYGLNMVKGSLLAMDIADGQVAFTEKAVLDWTDMYIKEADYSYPRSIYGSVLTDTALYLLMENPSNYNNYDLYAFDLATGSRKTITAPDVHSITPYKDGSLLCNVFNWETMYTADGKMLPPSLSILNPTTGEMVKLMDAPAQQVGGIVYDAASDTIYALGAGELFYSKAGAAFETAAYMPCDYPQDRMPAAILPGGYYAAIPNYASVYVRNTDPAQRPTRVLRIAGGYADEVTNAFMAAHPDIPVIFTQDYYGTAEAVSQNMISGSKSADLFLLGLSYGGFPDLRQKGYTADLSQSAILTQAVQDMYPQFISGLFKDGKLVAFPQSIYMNTTSYAPKVLEKLGLQEPPKTLSEMIDLYVTWVEEYAEKHPDLQLMQNVWDIRQQLLSDIFTQYVTYYQKTGETLKFDTPVFHELLKKLDEAMPILKELNPEDEDSMNARTYIMNGGQDNEPTALFNSYFDLNPGSYSYQNFEGYEPLYLSVAEGMEPVVSAQMQIFVMNPNSANQDLALQYLEFFAQNMPRALSITLRPEDNTPVEDPYYQKNMENMQKYLDEMKEQLKTAAPENVKDLESSIQSYEENMKWNEKYRWSVSEEGITQYRAAVPYISIMGENITLLAGSEESTTLLRRYMEGQINSQQFIKEFDRIIRMIQMENGQ